MPWSPGNLLCWVKLLPAAMLMPVLPGEASGSVEGLALGQAALPCSSCSLLSPSSCGLPCCPPAAALRRWEGRMWPAMAKEELWGLQPGWHPAWVTPQPQSLSSSFAETLGRFGGQATRSGVMPFPKDVCVQVLAWPSAWCPPLCRADL